MEGAIEDDLEVDSDSDNVFYVDDGYTFTPLYAKTPAYSAR